MRPINAGNLDFGFRDTYRRPIFATSVELYNWAATITSQTQEGQPYHDALKIWEDTCGLIADLFNGTKTFVNPFTGETQNYPLLLDQDDVQRMMVEDFNTRLVSWPLFPLGYLYEEDNNQEWYEVLTKWSHRIERFVKSQGERYLRMLKVLALEYNPLSDYWIQRTELGANAPYVSLTNGTKEEPTISDWTASNNGKTDYKTKAGTGGEQPKTSNYSTTYDDASNGRLAGYQTNDGATISEIPNSGYVRKLKEEGNKSGTIQDIIEKEMELAKEFGNITESFFDSLNKEIFLSYYKGA